MGKDAWRWETIKHAAAAVYVAGPSAALRFAQDDRVIAGASE
jgi:hypothetical protein